MTRRSNDIWLAAVRKYTDIMEPFMKEMSDGDKLWLAAWLACLAHDDGTQILERMAAIKELE
jgi:hypothetical protein